MNTCMDRLKLTNMNMSTSMPMLTSMAPTPNAMTISTVASTVNISTGTQRSLGRESGCESNTFNFKAE